MFIKTNAIYKKINSYLCLEFKSLYFMRKTLFTLFILLSFFCAAQDFDKYFVNKTLRVDYIFAGDASSQFVVLDQLCELPQWAGRRHNLAKSYLDGNGKVEMIDLKTGESIYKTTFSSLFQEWLTTEEATRISKSFENVYLLPFPREKVEIEISFRNRDGIYETKFSHVVDPRDILIHKKGYKKVTPHTQIHKGGDITKCINVAILAEGFKKEEMDSFRKYANESVNQIFLHEPFGRYKESFNFFIVESLSEDTGVSVPRNGEWKNTAFHSHFDTFYSDRYLTTNRVKDIHDALAGIPYEHIIILANTEVYGGGGIFNAYTLTTTGHYNFKPVVVHEFGHSFAGLADEYYSEGENIVDDTYSLDVEPWEQNITTLIDFNSKWKDMLSPRVPVPTLLSDSTKYATGVYEGAGYSSKGIYRGCIDCRMRTNTAKDFCTVCQRAIERLILFYMKE